MCSTTAPLHIPSITLGLRHCLLAWHHFSSGISCQHIEVVQLSIPAANCDEDVARCCHTSPVVKLQKYRSWRQMVQMPAADSAAPNLLQARLTPCIPPVLQAGAILDSEQDWVVLVSTSISGWVSIRADWRTHPFARKLICNSEDVFYCMLLNASTVVMHVTKCHQ